MMNVRRPRLLLSIGGNAIGLIERLIGLVGEGAVQPVTCLFWQSIPSRTHICEFGIAPLRWQGVSHQQRAYRRFGQVDLIIVPANFVVREDADPLAVPLDVGYVENLWMLWRQIFLANMDLEVTKPLTEPDESRLIKRLVAEQQ